MTAVLEIMIGKLQPDAPLNGPLWFLETLFISLMIYAAFHFIKKEKYLHILCFVLPVVVYMFTKYSECAKILPFHLLRCLEAVFYIHLGWCYNKYESTIKINKYLLLAVSFAVFVIGVFFSYRYYDVQTALFVNTKAYVYNLPLSIVTAIAGIMMIVSFSEIVKYMKFVNWFGRNSLVVVCVHFPLMERLNYFCFYCFTDLGVTSMPSKALLAIGCYGVTVAFSCLAILFCKKYVPKLSGYGNLIPV